MKWIRWIIMAPAGLLCGWVCYAFGKLLNNAALRAEYYAALPEWLVELQASALMGFVSVEAAQRIAPSNKFTASIAQTVLVSALAGSFLGINLFLSEHWSAFLSAAVIGGSVAALIAHRRRMIRQLTDAHQRELGVSKETPR